MLVFLSLTFIMRALRAMSMTVIYAPDGSGVLVTRDHRDAHRCTAYSRGGGAGETRDEGGAGRVRTSRALCVCVGYCASSETKAFLSRDHVQVSFSRGNFVYMGVVPAVTICIVVYAEEDNPIALHDSLFAALILRKFDDSEAMNNVMSGARIL